MDNSIPDGEPPKNQAPPGPEKLPATPPFGQSLPVFTRRVSPWDLYLGSLAVLWNLTIALPVICLLLLATMGGTAQILALLLIPVMWLGLLVALVSVISLIVYVLTARPSQKRILASVVVIVASISFLLWQGIGGIGVQDRTRDANSNARTRIEQSQ